MIRRILSRLFGRRELPERTRVWLREHHYYMTVRVLIGPGVVVRGGCLMSPDRPPPDWVPGDHAMISVTFPRGYDPAGFPQDALRAALPDVPILLHLPNGQTMFFNDAAERFMHRVFRRQWRPEPTTNGGRK